MPEGNRSQQPELTHERSFDPMKDQSFLEHLVMGSSVQLLDGRLGNSVTLFSDPTLQINSDAVLRPLGLKDDLSNITEIQESRKRQGTVGGWPQVFNASRGVLLTAEPMLVLSELDKNGKISPELRYVLTSVSEPERTLSFEEAQPLLDQISLMPGFGDGETPLFTFERDIEHGTLIVRYNFPHDR